MKHQKQPKLIIRKELLVLVLTLNLFVFYPRQVCAGVKFFETMGVSTAVGTVLGASTLAFYSEPGGHLINVALGAGAGALTGAGILAYQWIAGSDDGHEPYYSHVNEKNKNTKLIARESRVIVLPPPVLPSRQTAVWMPVVSFALN